MEKILLNKEQEKRFMKKLIDSDIEGLEELKKILKEELNIQEKISEYDIYDLLNYTISLNCMVVCGERSNFIESVFIETQELYFKYKNLLFDMFKNDFMKYYE